MTPEHGPINEPKKQGSNDLQADMCTLMYGVSGIIEMTWRLDLLRRNHPELLIGVDWITSLRLMANHHL
jgi:hypothetical protein